MKINLYTIALVCIISVLFLSCGNNSPQNKSNVKEETANEEKPDKKETVNEDIPEDFFAFIDKFANDKDFQLSRIKFPVSYQLKEIYGETQKEGNDVYYDGLEEKYYKIIPVKKQDWKHITKKYLTEDYYPEDSYKSQWVKQADDTIDMIMGWVDSESDYHIRFKKIDGQWYLTNYWDAYDYQYGNF